MECVIASSGPLGNAHRQCYTNCSNAIGIAQRFSNSGFAFTDYPSTQPINVPLAVNQLNSHANVYSVVVGESNSDDDPLGVAL